MGGIGFLCGACLVTVLLVEPLGATSFELRLVKGQRNGAASEAINVTEDYLQREARLASTDGVPGVRAILASSGASVRR